MQFKDNMALLAEAASLDIKQNSELNLERDAVKSAYKSIGECADVINHTAETVPVFRTTNNEYYTEMNYLVPFMQDNDIKSVAKALDAVAEANGLQAKSVGLFVESEAAVMSMLEKAAEKSKATGNKAVEKKAVEKVAKSQKVVDKLTASGYKVAKKKDVEACPKCGKKKCVCKECDTPNGKC